MKNPFWTKLLAIMGTILAWIPILGTLIISIIGSIIDQKILFDYLMPAALGMFAFVGGGLLLWAGFRAENYLKPIIWSLAIMAVMLLGGQQIAVLSGLSSGARSATSWINYLVIGIFVLYTLFLLRLAILGIRLCKQIFRAEAK